MATSAQNDSLARRYAARKSRRQVMDRLGLIGLQILMTLVLITFLAPTLWMISSSLKSRPEVFAVPIVWIPAKPQWGNYKEALSMLPFARFALNTFVLCLLAVTGTVICASPPR